MINVVDSPCGRGKTQKVIKFMKQYGNDYNFLYVAPFLSEVKRIIEGCQDTVLFEQPDFNRDKNKTEGLRRLINQEKNVSCTHSLFQIIDEDIINILKEKEYIVILDETLDIIGHFELVQKDIEMLKGYNYIKVHNNNIVTLDKEYPQKYGEFSYLLNRIKTRKTILVDNTVFFWILDESIFKSLDFYILTFLFDYSIMKMYFDAFNIEYDVYRLKDKGEKAPNNPLWSDIVPYDDKHLYEFKSFLKDNIEIYEGVFNKIGQKDTALSKKWFSSSKKKKLQVLGKNICNFFRSVSKTKSCESLWTVFNDYKDDVAQQKYKSCFLAHNARGEDQYKDRTGIAYCVNKYLHPKLVQLFSALGIEISKEQRDGYALSEMIQFLMRSRLRVADNKTRVCLYIPSKRMRVLLKNFVDT